MKNFQVTMNGDLEQPNEIGGYIHCKECVAEWVAGQAGKDVSPKEYSRISVGRTAKGLQVWCDRHNKNILYVQIDKAD